MAEASFEQIMRDLKKKIYHPVYFLSGDEPYYIDRISDYIQEHVLDETEKTFNQTVIYGKDTHSRTVINAAKRFPMMANHQVVVVKEAQELQEFDELIHYVEQPLKSSLLVLCYKYKNPDKRKKVFKSLRRHALCFVSKKLYDDKLPGWISNYVTAKKLNIQPKATALLAEFLGSDLSKIVNELEKLIITLEENQNTITANHVERNIGISKDYNHFELQNALGKRDVLKANRIVNYFADNQRNNHISQTIASLYFFFSKLLIYYWLKDKSKQSIASALRIHPYFVSEYVQAARNYNPNKVISIISLLREYDMKSKGFEGTAIPEGELLKELTFKILH